MTRLFVFSVSEDSKIQFFEHLRRTKSTSCFATTVYPNPSSGDFHLSAQHLVRADVFDILGQLHYSTSGTVIPDSALQRGVYMVRIITDNDISVRKIVKQ
ncbi:MAG: T9SS type A sorting domain-containing protein [Bacteroidales bacterium]|nr:T9SS type A sorting domain-containing protein [Bacteroidales bacterium]